MKQLVLVRHAKSSWKDPSLTDLMRPLKKRGLKDAAEMANRLGALDLHIDRVFLSPARRVVETADLLAQKGGFGVNNSEIVAELYTFSYEDLILYLRSIDDDLDCVAIVGHNPAITDLVNFLALEEIANIPTCGVAVLELDIRKWSTLRAGGAVLKHYDYPKNEVDLDI